MINRLLAVVLLSLLVAIGQGAPAQEAAYRSNNIGVAYLEQYNFEAAIAAFRRALEQDPSLGLARLNLGIALFYGGQAEAAATELERARTALPDRPHADYVLGLISRAANNVDEALAAFARAQRLDATDPGIAINIGQLHLQARRYAEAVAAFKVAAAAEPYNATAAYGLATALMRSGAVDEGKPAMDKFEKLRESSYATTFSQAYLEQGRYAEAIASTGTEAGLVDERVPDVRFTNASSMLPAAPGGAAAVALFDADGDGDLDLAAAGDTLRLYRNTGGQLADITGSTFTRPPAGPANGLVAGDVDNDGDSDLLWLGSSGSPILYRQDDGLKFVEAAGAGLPRMQSVRTAAWLDADHDGDLDLILAGLDEHKVPAAYLLRNSGNGTFVDISQAAGINASREIVSLVPTDFDNRRDIDIFAATGTGPLLLRNLRDGSFRDVASEVGLATPGDAGLSAASVADINKDGYPDFFFGRASAAGTFAMSDGRGRFAAAAAPDVTSGARSAQFLDYDNDGVIDLLVITPQGPRLLRNLGARWSDVTASAFAAAGAGAAGDRPSLASGDLDGDGDLDVVLGGGASGPIVLRNDGASRSRSLALRLQSRVTNRSAVGTKIEVRAGSLKQRIETSAASPAAGPSSILFGFGSRPGADVARVLWPSGILQAETADASAASAVLAGTLKVEELDRKPSSCPYLFTWNGTRFEFITDFLGGGEMGYWLAPGLRNSPDPEEYVRIDGRALAPKDGRYELRVTNELEEAVFLDRADLIAVAHPGDVAVYPNEGLRSTADPHKLYAVRDERLPLAAVDEHGHDVLDRLARLDRRAPDDFALERVRGYAAEHSVTITLPGGDATRRVLLLTGWTDYAFSGDNVAAHQSGLKMTPPSLEVLGVDGRWRTTIAEIGFPVGRPQTVLVDLAGKLPAGARRVRIATTMRVYWDRIAVGTADGDARIIETRMAPVRSQLAWRGFSAYESPDGKEPYGFDYNTVSATSPWKLLPGRYTREGDVRDLLSAVDDRFVVSRPGDEIALSFDATALPELPAGWTRTFLLHADGFSKEMDVNSASPDELGPLPFHGMAQYPYPAASAPARSAGYRDDIDRDNTRIVKRPLPPLELSRRELPVVRIDPGRRP
jgi:Tfp pilus assembly protein PilF